MAEESYLKSARAWIWMHFNYIGAHALKENIDLAEDLLALVTTEADLGLALIRQEQREPGDTSKSWTS